MHVEDRPGESTFCKIGRLELPLLCGLGVAPAAFESATGMTKGWNLFVRWPAHPATSHRQDLTEDPRPSLVGLHASLNPVSQPRLLRRHRSRAGPGRRRRAWLSLCLPVRLAKRVRVVCAAGGCDWGLRSAGGNACGEWLETPAVRHALLVVPVACSSSLTAVGFDEAVDLSVAALDIRAHFALRFDA
jgi:hypothetical protein